MQDEGRETMDEEEREMMEGKETDEERRKGREGRKKEEEGSGGRGEKMREEGRGGGDAGVGGSEGVSKERNEKVEAEVGGGRGRRERGGKQWQQSHQTCCVWSKCVYPQLGKVW